MAGQVWLVVSLFIIVGVVPWLAAADKLPQIVYNPDGTTKLEIIDTGIAGAALQGRLSWQTPDASQVWIQYPVNQQGRVPWTPAQFTYSVVSDPAKRVVPRVPTFIHSTPQIVSFDERVHPNLQLVSPSNTQEQPSRSIRRLETRVPAQAQSLPVEIEYDYDYEYIEEALLENKHIAAPSDHELPEPVMNKFAGPEPVMNKFAGPEPVMNKFAGPEPVMNKFAGPEPVMNKFAGPEPVMNKFAGPEPVMNKFAGPEPVMNKFAGPEPVMNKFAGPEPVMNKFAGPEPVMNKFAGPESVMNKFAGPEPVMNKFAGPEPEMDKFPGPVMDKFPGPVMDKFTGPMMDKFPGPVMDKFPGPVMDKFPGPVMDKFPGPMMDKFPGPVMDKFPGPVMDKFPGPAMNKFPGPEQDTFSELFSIDERDLLNLQLPVMNKFPGLETDELHDTTTDEPTVITTERPIQTTSVRDRFTLPFTTTTSRSLPFTEARVTPSPTIFRPTPQTRPMMNKFPGPAESRVTPFPRRFRPTTQRTMMNKFPGPIESRLTPVRRRFRPSTERTVMEKFPGPTESPIVDVDTTDEEIISVTEPVFENIVINELDSTNAVETEEQVEDTTELGPVIRLTSRGRPRLTKPAQKRRPENRKQSFIHSPNQFTTQNQNNRPVPQLIVDTSLRQSNRVQPNTRENNDNSFRFRRPGRITQQIPENNQLDQSQPITDPSLRQSDLAQPSIIADNENRLRPRRPGVRRFRTGGRRRQGIRRIPKQSIAAITPIQLPSTDISLPDEGRGAARSRPRGLRFRS